MGRTHEALVIHEGFNQPQSVVDRFLEFTNNVFPALVVSGGEFARSDIVTDARNAPTLYVAHPKLTNDIRPSDDLMLSVPADGDEFPGVTKSLAHHYYGAGRKYLTTSYYVFRGSLLAFDSRDVGEIKSIDNLDGTHGTRIKGNKYYRSCQSVAKSVGKVIGFERGLVDTYEIDEIGEIHDMRKMHELVGEKELDALLSLYGPKHPEQFAVASL